MDRGAGQSTVHGVAKELGMTGQLGMHPHNNGIVFQGILKERHDQSTDLWKTLQGIQNKREDLFNEQLLTVIVYLFVEEKSWTFISYDIQKLTQNGS